MKASLAEFENRLSEQECEIKLHRAVNDIRRLARINPSLESHFGQDLLEDLLGPSDALRRRSQYSSAVVGLYAAWESYVERQIEAYIRECISGETGHRSDICKHHLPKTLEILSSIEKGAARYKDLDESTLLEGALSVQRGSFEQVNTVALVHHTPNLRSSSIREMLAGVGAAAVWEEVLKDARLARHLMNAGLPESRDGKFSFLDDLCERRNEVAHAGNPQSIFDENYQLAYSKGLRALGRSLFERLYLFSFDEQSLHFKVLGEYDERYSGNIAIVKVEENGSAKVGDECLVVSSTSIRSVHRIISLQDNGKDAEEFAATTAAEFGVKLDSRIPKKGRVFVRSSSPYP